MGASRNDGRKIFGYPISAKAASPLSDSHT
jgi:hypothetical protein